jgi:hypothetical protein
MPRHYQSIDRNEFNPAEINQDGDREDPGSKWKKALPFIGGGLLLILLLRKK